MLLTDGAYNQSAFGRNLANGRCAMPAQLRAHRTREVILEPRVRKPLFE